MLTFGLDVVLKGKNFGTLEENVGDIFIIIVAIMALGENIDANVTEVPIGRQSFVGEEPKKSFDFVWCIGFPNPSEYGMFRFRMVIGSSGLIQLSVHAAGSEMASVRLVPNGMVSFGRIQMEGYTQDGLMNGCWDLKWNNIEIPGAIHKDILDGHLREVISHRALDYAFQAAQMRDPSVFPEAHLIPLAHSQSYDK